jgi:hypothetical protein
MRPSFLLTTFLAVAATVFSATIYVPDDFAMIQSAINASSNGDTVIVRPGIYAENLDFGPSGSPRAITLVSEQGPDATIIDGMQSGSVVTFKSGEGPGSVLDGFTLANGSGNYFSGDYLGGGIWIEQSSPKILNNIISFNFSNMGGGILCLDNASPVIEGNEICHNNAQQGLVGGGGGGIFLYQCFVQIIDNHIHDNTTDAGGGGIGGDDYIAAINDNRIHGNQAVRGGGIQGSQSCTPDLFNNLIYLNTAVESGGGVYYSSQSLPIYVNNMIYGNACGTAGGGIYCPGWAQIYNNTVYGNKAAGQGGGIHGSATSCQIRNTIVWNNSAPIGPEIDGASLTVEYCDVKGGWPGTGNIDADPLFADPAKDDFHLYYPSPCRDKGDNAATIGGYDFEHDPRIAQGTVDMGADEFHRRLYSTDHAAPGGSIQVKIVGPPGTVPVGLFLGSGILPVPLNTYWGKFYLQYPWYLIVLPASIPGSGIMVLPATVPSSPPAPYDVPLQAMIGSALSNLWVVEVR